MTFEEELIDKLKKLVDSTFAGDRTAAFNHYDTDHDGKISSDEMYQLLSDAGVGNSLTRKIWVKGIIQHVDTDGDGKISQAELESRLS